MSKDAKAEAPKRKGPQQLVTKDVDPCPRCGNGHNAMVFKPLARAFGRANFWAMCPDNKEPILATVAVDLEYVEPKKETENGAADGAGDRQKGEGG